MALSVHKTRPSANDLLHVILRFSITSLCIESWERCDARSQVNTIKAHATSKNKYANPFPHNIRRCFIQGFPCSSGWIVRWNLWQLLLCQLSPLPTHRLSTYPNMAYGKTRRRLWNRSVEMSVFLQSSGQKFFGFHMDIQYFRDFCHLLSQISFTSYPLSVKVDAP